MPHTHDRMNPLHGETPRTDLTRGEPSPCGVSLGLLQRAEDHVAAMDDAGRAAWARLPQSEKIAATLPSRRRADARLQTEGGA